MTVHFEDGTIRIHKVVASPYDNNAYVVVCQVTGASVMIDTPRYVDRVLEEAVGTELVATVITHGHFDHIEGFKVFTSRSQAPIGIHKNDAPKLPSPPSFYIDDGDSIPFGELALEVMHTPGHTPGGICLRIGKHLFSGDTLFPGGPGKTGSPRDFREILNSIEHRLLPLPEETMVYPGHGKDTTIRDALAEFSVFASNPVEASLHGEVRWAPNQTLHSLS
jgi:glyoxylase-like metal-dependent hydrolase (beta-lactamase superfamily II)